VTKTGTTSEKTSGLENIVPGVFTPVLAKHFKILFANRLYLGGRRPNAAKFRADAKAGGSLAET
jgi:hypothetical protein